MFRRIVGIDAFAGVADHDRGVVTRRQSRVRRRRAAREREIVGADRQMTALRHRVARVDDEVHDHLLKLREIGAHGPQHRREAGRQRDVLADQPPQHLLDVLDHGVQIELDRLKDLPAPEREQLARHRRGLFSRPANLRQPLVRRAVRHFIFGERGETR